MPSGTKIPSIGGSSSTLRLRKSASIKGSNENGIRSNHLPNGSTNKGETITWGRTPDGTGTQYRGQRLTIVFRVPQTYDVLSSIFNPKKPKSLFDLVILAVLFLQIVVFILLPPTL